MKFSFSRIFVVCGFCLGIFSLGAQSTQRLWHLYLTDGNFLQAERIDTLADGQLAVYGLHSTVPLLIPSAAVQQIRQSPRGSLQDRNGRTVQAEGWYLEGSTMLLTAEVAGQSSELRNSLSFQFGGGYYYRPWLALGAGLGIDWYDEPILPVYGQVRAYLPGHVSTLYAQLQLGHGFPTQEIFQEATFERTHGGMLWHPAIGLRLASKRRMDYHLDIGYRFQRLRYEFEAPDNGWWWTFDETRKIRYRSFVIRLSSTF